jgi:beta-xylosidase
MVTTRDGALQIAVTEAASSAAAGSAAGTFYGVAPARGRYTATTTVELGGTASATMTGLAAYGDAANALGLGVSAGGRLMLWKVEKGQRHTLADQPLPAVGGGATAAVHLRMEAWDGRRYQFSWSTDGRSWTPIPQKGEGPPEIDGDYLPPWDRAVRAGLFVTGAAGATGTFHSFRLAYGAPLAAQAQTRD